MAIFGKPRLVQLVEVAARAEALRWRRRAGGTTRRAAFAAAGAVLGLLALFGLHLALWAALARPLGPVGAAVAVAALDLVLCLALGWVAARRPGDPVAQGAAAVRDDALRGAQAEASSLGGLLHRPPEERVPRSGRVRVYPTGR